MELNFKVKHFKDLSVYELYDLLKLRMDIFVVEQNCTYSDCDEKDKDAWHVLGFNENNEVVAYARVLAPGVAYESSSIGRVVVRADHRKFKLGYSLMDKAIQTVNEVFNVDTITISAQYHLERFYANLGFISKGDTYLEDDIPHIKMIRKHAESLS
jgi:ElaA protein